MRRPASVIARRVVVADAAGRKPPTKRSLLVATCSLHDFTSTLDGRDRALILRLPLTPARSALSNGALVRGCMIRDLDS
jgi:hypothetical protein